MIKRYKTNQERRSIRTRAKIKSPLGLPRLSVFRSNKYISAQIIDDKKAHTLAEARGKDPKMVGKEVAEKAKKLKVAKIVFDRGGYSYHGQVRQLAEAAREHGLKF